MPSSNPTGGRPRADIIDLRTPLEFLASIPGQLVSTREPVDPVAELAGVCKLIGTGTPVEPPTRTGLAMIFERVTGYDMPVVVGAIASRERSAGPGDTLVPGWCL